MSRVKSGAILLMRHCWTKEICTHRGSPPNAFVIVKVHRKIEGVGVSSCSAARRSNWLASASSNLSK